MAKRSLMVELLEHVEKLAGGLDELKVVDARLGLFYTGVRLSDGSCGVAYTPREEAYLGSCCPSSYRSLPNAGRFSGRPAKELSMLSLGRNPFERSVGVAVINALSSRVLFNGDYDVVYGVDAASLVDVREEDTLALVGAFTPYLRRYSGRVARLIVFELKREALGNLGRGVEVYGASEYYMLEEADVAIVTGSVFVTGLEDLVFQHLRSAREVALVGPTASMVPDPLFRHGVTVVGGVRVDNPGEALRIISEGGAGGALSRVATKFAVKNTG